MIQTRENFSPAMRFQYKPKKRRPRLGEARPMPIRPQLDLRGPGKSPRKML